LNKIGDLALLVAIGLIYLFFNTLNFENVFLLTPFFVDKFIYIYNYKFFILDVICFFLMISAVIKSAQIGLHV
jgi:NADH:ubiquinone oxidoreductase subunit 5 (subunit L)/multisubunit Na+/H+ antiporter MnhA subunit